MVSPKGGSAFNPDAQRLPVEPGDLALVQGDRASFATFLEPFAAALPDQSDRLLSTLVDNLYAFYIADTLAYLTRMLPQVRRAGGLRLRPARPPGPDKLHAPDLATMAQAPGQALASWATYHRATGGALLMEARALFRHLSVPRALKDQNIPIATEQLMDGRFAEELPTSHYLQDLIVESVAATFYWDAQELTRREEACRQAFLGCLAGLGVRFLRLSRPADAARLQQVALADGMVMADSLLRILLPIDVYRKRRLEALAVFHDLVAPQLLSAAG